MVIDMLSRRGIFRHLGGAGAVAVAASIVPSLARAQDATPTVDLEANKALARRFHDEIFEQGNLAIADEILTPDFAWRGPPNSAEPLVGPEAIKQAATEVREYFSNPVLTDDDEIAEADRVAIRWTLTGTVQTESGGVPVDYTGIDIFRIADGKLAELWQNTDDFGLEQQLAAVGTPTPSGAMAAIAEAWTAAWNAHDSAQIAALFTPDGLYEDLAFDLAARGTDEIIAFADGFFSAAPDLHIDLIAGFGTEEWAAAEWLFSGTDTGGVAGEPTGKRFEVRGATIFELQDGKATRNTDFYNASTVLGQLGLRATPTA